MASYTHIRVDGQPTRVQNHQLARARQHSAYLRHHDELRIPARDKAGKNFDKDTIATFFEVFDRDIWKPRALDCDTLVKLCHVFWWLKCDPSPLRSSEEVQGLRSKIQTDNWKSTKPWCTNRLVVSLVFGWNEQLTPSCNELVHKTMAEQENLFEDMPNVTCKDPPGNKMFTH